MARIMVRNKSGKLVYIDEKDDPTNAPTTRKGRVAAGQPRKDVAPDERRQQRAEKVGSTSFLPGVGIATDALGWGARKVGLNRVADVLDKGRDLERRAVSGFTMGLDKRLRSGTNAVVDALKGENIADAYNANMAAEQAVAGQLAERTGLAGDIAEFGGAMAAPIKGAGVAVKGYRALRGAKPVGRTAAHLVGGAGAGLTGGALEGAARSEDLTDIGQVARNTLKGGAVGAGLGAGLGAAAIPIGGAARAVARKFQGARGANAAAIQAGRDADEMVLEAVNRGGGIPRAENQITNMMEQGTDPILADVNPQAQQQLKALMDRGVPGTEDVAERLTDRAALRGGRLKKKIAELSNVDDMMTSGARQQNMAAQRQAQNKEGYKIGGVLEEKVAIPRALRRKLSPTGQPEDETFKGIYKQAVKDYNADFKNPRLEKLRKGQDPTANATVRVMDMVLKQYRGKISSLFKDPATAGRAKALRSQFDELRTRMRDSHPEFAKLLDEHALMIGKERAAEIGDKLGPRIFSDPRKVMDVINNPQAHDVDPGDLLHLREALADRAFTMAEKKAGSVADEIRLATADPVNRKEANDLWEFILNGPNKVDEVNKWIKAEGNARQTEKRILGGSSTSQNEAGLAQQADAIEQMLVNTGRTVAGVASNSPGVYLNALFLTAKYGLRAARGADRKSIEKMQLKRLMRRAERGDLTRLEARVARERARRVAKDTRNMNLVGRAAVHPVPLVIPNELEE